MNDMAKKAREAMKSKARKMAGEKDQKVDSSDWSPSEPINAEAKTGMRPVSRRAYKKGGKVEGACAPTNLGRKARKSGGKVESEKAEAAEYAKAKTNRDVKAANEERPGVKHVGGMKKGGRAKKMDGGTLDKMVSPEMRSRIEAGAKTPTQMPKNPPMPPRRPAEPVGGEGTKPVGLNKDQIERLEAGRKDGGKAKARKDGGRTKFGMTTPRGNEMAKQEKDDYIYSAPPKMPDVVMGEVFEGRGNAPLYNDPKANRKDGGKAKARKDGGKVATTLAGQKKVQAEQAEASETHRGKASNYKKGGRAGKMMGGVMGDPRMSIVKKNAMDFGSGAQGTPYKKGGKAKKMGGGALSAGLMGGLLPAMSMGIMGKDKDEAEGKKKGGRVERKAGGRTKAKGKTNINIVIAAGKPATPDMMQGPGGPPMPPPGVPVPLPGGPGGMPMPMGGMGGGAPGGMPSMPMPPGPPQMPGGPMGRKSGGRITKIAKSYKDMEAGAAGGEGHLQKTDIAKTGKSAPAYRSGGKVFRSYKDMDAGSGSGRGRLEKTEIEAHKN
jgi:hypothetical protein